MSAIINTYQKGGAMIQIISDKQKILFPIFVVCCLLLVGVGVGRGVTVNWYAEDVNGNDCLSPGTTEQLILKLRAENAGGADHNVNVITVTSTGNPLKIEDVISNTVKLWKDIVDNWEGGNAVCIGTSTFSSDTPSKIVFSPLADSVPSGLNRYFYVTYDLRTSVTDRHTIDVEISNTTDIAMDEGGTVVFPNGAPLNSSGSPGYDTIKVIATGYTVDTIPAQIAGRPFGVKIQMIDGDGNLDLDYTGGMVFVTGAGGDFAPTPAPDGTTPSYPPAETWQGLSDRGEKIFPVILYKKETGRKLKVSNEGEERETNPFTIQPGIKFNFSLPQNMPVETSADINVEVYEPYQNEFVYTGTAQFTSTDNQATLPGNYIFSAGETSKLFSNGITFGTVDNHTVTLTDTIVSNITGTQTVIVQSENAGYRSINYPNPFDPHQGTTTIQFYMNGEGKAKVKIYTLTGNLVREWDVEAHAGINTAFQWDGRDKDGNMVANGTYLCRIKTDNKKETIKISILK